MTWYKDSKMKALYAQTAKKIYSKQKVKKFPTELPPLPQQNAAHRLHWTRSSASWINPAQLCKDHTRLDTRLLLEWNSLGLQNSRLAELIKWNILVSVLEHMHARRESVPMQLLVLSVNVRTTGTPVCSVNTSQFPLSFQLYLTPATSIIPFEMLNSDRSLSLILLFLLIVVFFPHCWFSILFKSLFYRIFASLSPCRSCFSRCYSCVDMISLQICSLYLNTTAYHTEHHTGQVFPNHQHITADKIMDMTCDKYLFIIEDCMFINTIHTFTTVLI